MLVHENNPCSQSVSHTQLSTNIQQLRPFLLRAHTAPSQPDKLTLTTDGGIVICPWGGCVLLSIHQGPEGHSLKSMIMH